MESIQLRSHVGTDGILKLEVPLEVRDSDLDVVIVVQPRGSRPPRQTEPDREPRSELGWPEGFFERVAGAWKGEPLRREDQGEYEARDDWR